MGFRVGIVDDEKLVLFGIQSLLASEDSPFSVCGVWQNASEALEACLKSPPDLLLTDIGMPGMDGLELITQLKKQQLPTKIVVLSCHDEYELVHKAFVLGADDYILKKDINKDSLLEVLSRILPLGTVQRGELPQRCRSFEAFAAENSSPGVLGIMGFKKEYDAEWKEIVWQPENNMVLQIVQDTLSGSDNVSLDKRGRLVVFLEPLSGQGPAMETDPRMERVRAGVSRYLNRRVYLSQVELAAFGNLNEAHAEGLPDLVKAECIFAVNHLLHRLKEYGLTSFADVPHYEDASYSSMLTEFDDFDSLADWMASFLENLYCHIKNRSREFGPLSNVRSYIESALQEDLSLGVLARQFGFSPNYLSALFKKETGLNYTEYINVKRIERARTLLRSSRLSAKEISYQCGYQNPNYFSRVFKKITGLTISEYRDSPISNL